MSTPYHFLFTLSANFQREFYTEKFIFLHNILLLFHSGNVNTISLLFNLSTNFQRDFSPEKFIFLLNILLLFLTVPMSTLITSLLLFPLIFKETFTQKCLFFFTIFSSSFTVAMATPYHFPFTLSANFQRDFYTKMFIFLQNILVLLDSTNVNTISLPFYSFR